MKIIPQKEEILKRTVREALAIDPLMSVRGLQRHFEYTHRKPISDKYASKLMRKVRNQVIAESDRKRMNERLAEVREKYRINMEYLARVIYWDNDNSLMKYGIDYPNLKERMAAVKLQCKLDADLFRLEMFAGMFENKRIREAVFRSRKTEPIYTEAEVK